MVASGLGGELAEFEQQFFDLLRLVLIGPEDQLVALGIDSNSQHIFRGFFVALVVEVIGEVVSPLVVVLFVLFDSHKHANGSSDLVGTESTQGDHFGLPCRTVKLLERLLDCQMVGQRGISDHRLVLVIGFEAGCRFQDIQRHERTDKLLGIQTGQAIDLHPGCQRLVVFVWIGDIDACDKRGDDRHFVGGGIDDDAVASGVGDQIDLSATRGSGLGRSLAALLLCELLLHHHLLLCLHFLGAHSARLRIGVLGRFEFQELRELFSDICGSHMLQLKLASQVVQNFIGLLLADNPMDLCKVRCGVHRLEPIGFAQGSHRSIRTDQLLELLDQIFGDQCVELVGRTDKTIRRKRFELLGIDARNQRRIDFLGLDDLQNTGELQHRKASGEQMAIDHVARFAQ